MNPVMPTAVFPETRTRRTRKSPRCWPLIGLLLILLGACAKKSVSEAGAGAGSAELPAAASHDAGLAYEHEWTLEVPGAKAPALLAEAQAACVEHRHGPCLLISARQSSAGYEAGTISVRIEPKAGTIWLQGLTSGGRVLSSKTVTSDLSQPIADTARNLELLRTHRDTLAALYKRSDLGVADLITLSREIASASGEIEAAERSGAELRQRVETHLITVQLQRPASELESADSSLGEVMDELWDEAFEGLMGGVIVLAYLVPVLLLLFPLLLIARWIWRRTAPRARPAERT
jgi:HAMP domain-containing protein